MSIENKTNQSETLTKEELLIRKKVNEYAKKYRTNLKLNNPKKYLQTLLMQKEYSRRYNKKNKEKINLIMQKQYYKRKGKDLAQVQLERNRKDFERIIKILNRNKSTEGVKLLRVVKKIYNTLIQKG